MDDSVLLARLLDKVDALAGEINSLSKKVAVYDSVHTAFERQRTRVNGLIIAVAGLIVSTVGAIGTILLVK